MLLLPFEEQTRRGGFLPCGRLGGEGCVAAANRGFFDVDFVDANTQS